MRPAASRPAAYAEAVTFGDALLRTAAGHPDTDALIMPSGRWTYAELAARAREIARSLAGVGIGRGDRVSVLMVNSFDLVAGMFGIALSGATVVPINARYRRREIAHVVAQGELSAVLTSDSADEHVDLPGLLAESVGGIDPGADPLALASPRAPKLRLIVLLGRRTVTGMLTEPGFFALGADIDDVELDRRRTLVGLRDPVLVLYTSGTTTAPRGALIAHEALVRTWHSVARAMRLAPGDRMWNPCPIFHIAALGVCVSCVLTASTIVTAPHFEPAGAVALLREHPPNALYPAYPVIALELLRAAGFDQIDFSDCTGMLCVGPPDTVRGLQEAYPDPIRVISTFGMTESSGCASLHDVDDPEALRLSTGGPLLPGLEVRIVDPESGAACAAGRAGEIQLRGPITCDGYYNDPVASAELLDQEGWMHTGDRGVVDARSQVSYLGRIKELMKVGGESVSPAEVEGTLMAHPAVHMAAVVGVPDERLGEVPVAFVEFATGAQASAEELLAHCRGLIARYKLPVAVEVVTEWPMSLTKIRKVDLRERATAARAKASVA